jgi:hypothetical protein
MLDLTFRGPLSRTVVWHVAARDARGENKQQGATHAEKTRKWAQKS